MAAIEQSEPVGVGPSGAGFNAKEARIHFLVVKSRLHKAKDPRPEFDKDTYEGLGRRHVALLGDIATLNFKVHNTAEGSVEGWVARYLYGKRNEENGSLEKLFELIKEPWPVHGDDLTEKDTNYEKELEENGFPQGFIESIEELEERLSHPPTHDEIIRQLLESGFLTAKKEV
jgi:hypothetical protein